MDHDDVLDKFHDIFNFFNSGFCNAYQKVRTRGKNKLLKYTNCFYRKWYYSALIPETILSPANILQLLSNNFADSTLIGYSVSIQNYSKLSNFQLKETVYSLENHPIVEDLRIFLNSCGSVVLLNEDDYIGTSQEQSILGELSISDPFYVQYLCEISINLKLIKKLPSINSNHAQVDSEACNSFFELSQREILKRLIHSTLNITVFQISEILPIDKNIINSNFFFNILRNSTPTDELFTNIYASMNINFDDVAEMSEDEYYDEVTSAIMSSTFFIGIIIDKYFYTLFGFYLKLIAPCYLTPYDFSDEIEFAVDTFKENDEISVAMFSPCSHHTLTKLGLDLFECNETSENSIKLQEGVTYEMIRHLLMVNLNVENPIINKFNTLISMNPEALFEKVYELKVKLNDNKALWKSFEIPENMLLHELYMEICYEFSFDLNLNYTFYPNLEENPFTEYSSPSVKRRSKKVVNVKLSELALNEKDKFLLILYDLVNQFSINPNIPVKSLKLELEITKIKDKSAHKYYPRVFRISKALKEFESDLY